MSRHIQPEVIVIGAGVIGCATAYFLGKYHKLRCLVLDRDAIGSQASGSAAGELSPFSRVPIADPFFSFCVDGLRLHYELAPVLVEESGVDYKFTNTPILHPAFVPEEVQHLKTMMALQSQAGMKVTWLDRQDLRALQTPLNEAVLGASCSEGEAQVESYPFTLALAQAAERYGATFISGEVVGLERRGERVEGVRTASGSLLSAGAVVIATGPWSRFASDWIGLRIPVEPMRGQIVHLRWQGPLPSHSIFHTIGYLLPKPSGVVYLGTTEEMVGFVPSPTPEGAASIMQAGLRLAPSVDSAQVVTVTACLRPVSEDERPIIGSVPRWNGLYLATGHGRKGILTSLNTGKYLAQLIADGRSEYPMEPFSAARLRQQMPHPS